MSKTYELWDAGSRNLIQAYDTKSDALEYVRAYVAEHGTSFVQSWVLLWDNDAADEAGQIAEGQTLLALAERSRPAPLGKRQRAG